MPDEDTHVEGPSRPPDVGNPTDVAALEDLDAHRKQQWDTDLTVMLQSDSGRRVLWAIIDRAGIHAPGYSESHAWMAMNEGGRAFGVWLIKELDRIDPAAYPRLLLAASQDRDVKRQVQEASLKRAREAQA